jgi:hypothetical protein
MRYSARRCRRRVSRDITGSWSGKKMMSRRAGGCGRRRMMRRHPNRTRRGMVVTRAARCDSRLRARRRSAALLMAMPIGNRRRLAYAAGAAFRGRSAYGQRGTKASAAGLGLKCRQHRQFRSLRLGACRLFRLRVRSVVAHWCDGGPISIGRVIRQPIRVRAGCGRRRMMHRLCGTVCMMR